MCRSAPVSCRDVFSGTGAGSAARPCGGATRNGEVPLRVAPPHGQTVDPAPAPLKKSLQEAEADRHNGSASPWHSWAGGEASEFSVRTKCEKLRGQGGTGEGAAEK